MTFSDAKDQIAKELFNSAYKNVFGITNRDVVCEKAANLYAEEKAREAWDRACELQRWNCERELNFGRSESVSQRVLNAPKPPYQIERNTDKTYKKTSKGSKA